MTLNQEVLVSKNREHEPRHRVDAVIILGMGPVEPFLVGEPIRRRVVIENERMRHNALAAKELIVRNYVTESGIIIPTGRPTATIETVADALENRKKPHYFARIAGTTQDKKIVLETSEAQLMADLIQKAVAKPGVFDRKHIRQNPRNKKHYQKPSAPYEPFKDKPEQ